MRQRPHVPDDLVLLAEHRPGRSHGLSGRRFIAIAHSITALMRCRTFRAVWTFTCQIGVRTSSTSALAISETGRLPMRGNAWRSRLFSEVRAWMGLR